VSALAEEENKRDTGCLREGSLAELQDREEGRLQTVLYHQPKGVGLYETKENREGFNFLYRGLGEKRECSSI